MINALAMSGGRAKADFDENMATLARLMKIEVADVYGNFDISLDHFLTDLSALFCPPRRATCSTSHPC